MAKSIADIIAKAKGRVAVTSFSSNVARIKAVAEAAQAAGRQLVVAGRALHRVIEVAIDTGYLPQGFKRLDQDQFSYLERREVVLLCTGSQGEPRAALARISEEEHPDISLSKGDLVIYSSRTIPGNEKAVGRIENNLSRIGCDLMTDATSWCTSPAIPAATSCAACTPGSARRWSCRCTGRRAISRRRPSSRASLVRSRCFRCSTARSSASRPIQPSSTRLRWAGSSATAGCSCPRRRARCARAASSPPSASWS